MCSERRKQNEIIGVVIKGQRAVAPGGALRTHAPARMRSQVHNLMKTLQEICGLFDQSRNWRSANMFDNRAVTQALTQPSKTGTIFIANNVTLPLFSSSINQHCVEVCEFELIAATQSTECSFKVDTGQQQVQQDELNGVDSETRVIIPKINYWTLNYSGTGFGSVSNYTKKIDCE